MFPLSRYGSWELNNQLFSHKLTYLTIKTNANFLINYRMLQVVDVNIKDKLCCQVINPNSSVAAYRTFT